MTQNTLLAEHINTAHTKAKLDEACKKLLAHKIILAWIMQQTLNEFKDYSVQEIAEKYIEGIPVISKCPVHADTGIEHQHDEHTTENMYGYGDTADENKGIYNDFTGEPDSGRIHGETNEDTTMEEGTVTFDIRFRAIVPHNGEYITLLINVEAQNEFYPGYPLVKRGIYYGCRMISAQYGTEFQNSHYEKIKKVYSIWICINPPKKKANTITKYEITEKNVLGKANEPVENYDLMTAIMICLKSSPDQDDGAKNVIDLLTTLLSTEISSSEKKKIIERDFDIPMQKEVTKEADGMCNYSDYVENCGIEKGRAEGRAEGLSLGISQGENLLAALVNRLLMDNRIEDIKLITNDSEARERLYKEYGLI